MALKCAANLVVFQLVIIVNPSSLKWFNKVQISLSNPKTNCAKYPTGWLWAIGQGKLTASKTWIKRSIPNPNPKQLWLTSRNFNN